LPLRATHRAGSPIGPARHAGKVCVCELQPLFDIGQPTLSHHLKKLRDAGLIDVERRGLWAYCYVLPGALEELSGWLST
jgi:ArsR family transcriptional regulator, arsenate/arsenite/antimonite-responsive transcriptional repressor